MSQRKNIMQAFLFCVFDTFPLSLCVCARFALLLASITKINITKNVIWSILLNSELSWWRSSSQIELKEGVALPGDVNNDEQITIADVTSLVNIILGKE